MSKWRETWVLDAPRGQRFKVQLEDDGKWWAFGHNLSTNECFYMRTFSSLGEAKKAVEKEKARQM